MKFTQELKGYKQEHPLYSVLRKSDVTLDDLAAYFQVSTKSIINWLSGNTKPKKVILEELDQIKEKLEAELPENLKGRK